ncbi:MAG: adenosylcobinamide amidohydrolase [Anaerolineales bacterium]
MQNDMIYPFPDISLEVNQQAVWLISKKTLFGLSSAVLGGGLGEFRSLFIYHVDKEYNHPDPLKHLTQIAVDQNLPSPTIGLLTAAKLERTAIETISYADLLVCAIITAGVSNATSAGISLPVDYQKPGTINIVVLVNRRLEPAAMVNAVITITEAKTDCLRRLGIHTQTGEIASGTSTDTVVVAHTGDGQPLAYAGAATPIGWLIGRVVRAALTKSLNGEG